MPAPGLSSRSCGRLAAPGPRPTSGHRLQVCERRSRPCTSRRAAGRAGRAAAAAGLDPPSSSGNPAAGASAPAAGAAAPPAGGSTPAAPLGLLARAAAQVLALVAALACLIPLPAHASGRLAAQPLQAAASYGLYLLFFASGTISRMLRHGQLAEARRDAQRSSGSARLALLLFAAAAVPGGHWAAWWDPSLAALAARAPGAAAAAAQLLPVVGYALMLAGWALNAAAAAALGKVGAPGLSAASCWWKPVQAQLHQLQWELAAAVSTVRLAAAGSASQLPSLFPPSPCLPPAGIQPSDCSRRAGDVGPVCAGAAPHLYQLHAAICGPRAQVGPGKAQRALGVQCKQACQLPCVGAARASDHAPSRAASLPACPTAAWAAPRRRPCCWEAACGTTPGARGWRRRCWRERLESGTAGTAAAPAASCHGC